MALLNFIYNSFKLDVIIDENNEPLFDAKQVAKILGYKDPKDAVQRHVDSEDKIEFRNLKEGIRTSLDRFHPQKIFINEPGVYSLVFGSRLPITKDFKRWILKEVIPQIRKTGSYSLDNKLLQLKDISEEDVKNMSDAQKKDFKGDLKKFFELLKDPQKQEKGSRGGKAFWRKIREKDVLYEEMQKKFAAISLILEN